MTHDLRFERLEDRQLLAVTITTGKKGLLLLTGDAANDIVAIDGTGVPGQVEVFVGGVSQGFFNSVQTIKGNLGLGNDELHLSAIHIGGNVDINMSFGADRFDVDTNTFGAANPDGNVFIGRSVIVSMGGDTGDFVEWTSDVAPFGIQVGANVTLTGVADVEFNGGGTDFNLQARDISIGGFASITLTGLGDVNGDGIHLDVDNVNVFGATNLKGSVAAERIELSNSSFIRKFVGTLGGGDDILDLDAAGNPNRFGAAMVVDFGIGNDTLDNQAGNLFAVAPKFTKGPEVVV
jgi:hypothetical protein